MPIELLMLMNAVGVLLGTILGGFSGLALGAFLIKRGYW